ncbi:CARDB domain-containing protein, partial [Methanospirillum stamsii]
LNIENQILATDLSYSEDLDDKLELLLKMGRYNEALDVSDQQIAMLGGDGFSRPRTIFLRGKTLSLLGRYNEALGFFDSLIRDGSLKGESLEQKALIMEKLGQDYEALDLSNSQLTPSISDTIHTSTAPINLLPDLTITKISMKQKENVIAGTLTIENKGSGDAGKFTITYFLTDTLKYDPIFGNNDIFVLGEDSANGLAVGDQRDSKDTKMFTIPGNVSPGSYAVGVFIDSNNVEEESDEENNVVYDISWVQVG